MTIKRTNMVLHKIKIIYILIYKKYAYSKIKNSQYFDFEWYQLVYEFEITNEQDYLLDYIDYGISNGRDPSPYFNTVLYNREHKVNPDWPLLQFIKSGMETTGGAYKDENALTDTQRLFKEKTSTSLVKNHNLHRKFAVFLQSGQGTLWKNWNDIDNRNWDLIINHYDSTHRNQIPCEIEFHQTGLLPGTKFSAFYEVLENYNELIVQYEYLLLLDDDIEISPNDISNLLKICATNKWELAQASLSLSSNCAYEVFFNAGAGWRKVNGVEIMMPVYSNKILPEVKDLLKKSISGWGVDTALSMIVNENGWHAAIVDDVKAHHLKPVNADVGSYYQMLHKENVYPEIEFTNLQKIYRFRKPYFYEIT